MSFFCVSICHLDVQSKFGSNFFLNLVLYNCVHLHLNLFQSSSHFICKQSAIIQPVVQLPLFSPLTNPVNLFPVGPSVLKLCLVSEGCNMVKLTQTGPLNENSLHYSFNLLAVCFTVRHYCYYSMSYSFLLINKRWRCYLPEIFISSLLTLFLLGILSVLRAPTAPVSVLVLAPGAGKRQIQNNKRKPYNSFVYTVQLGSNTQFLFFNTNFFNFFWSISRIF